MRRLRIGIIGVGGMGTFHARTLADLADVDVAAVHDPHGPNADRIRDELGAVVVDDPNELIAGSDLDGLVIASPDDTHADLALAAISHGLPTLCEKPLATSAESARAVVEAEVESGRRLVQLGFMREYDTAHRQIESALGGLGPIAHVHAVHRNASPTPRPIEQIVGQSMVHDIHTVRYLTGAEFASVYASASTPTDGSFRHVVAVGRLSSGAHAVVEFDDGSSAYDVGLEVLAASGDVLMSPPLRPIVRSSGSFGVELGTDWFGWFADAYREQDRAWVDSIQTGTPTGPTVWDGFAAQVVVDEILASLRSGAPAAVEAGAPPDLYR